MRPREKPLPDPNRELKEGEFRVWVTRGQDRITHEIVSDKWKNGSVWWPDEGKRLPRSEWSDTYEKAKKKMIRKLKAHLKKATSRLKRIERELNNGLPNSTEEKPWKMPERQNRERMQAYRSNVL
jgi:hypothetical protein